MCCKGGVCQSKACSINTSTCIDTAAPEQPSDKAPLHRLCLASAAALLGECGEGGWNGVWVGGLGGGLVLEEGWSVDAAIGLLSSPLHRLHGLLRPVPAV